PDTPVVTESTPDTVVTSTDELGLAVVETGVRMPVFAEAVVTEEEELVRAPFRAPRQDRN
ncbi:MAG: hypothetical protein DCF16_11530, partial [Alphaproteobacteria bacterium]